MSFVTIANFQECEGKLATFLETRHGIRFDTPEDLTEMRQTLYRAMTEVSSTKRPNDTLRTLNNQAINKALATLLSEQRENQRRLLGPGGPGGPGGPVGPVGPADTAQRRDLDLYGMRRLADRVPVPKSTSDMSRGDVVAATHQAEVEARAPPPAPANNSARAAEVVAALRPEDFEARLKELTAMRDVPEMLPPQLDAPEMSKLPWEAESTQTNTNTIIPRMDPQAMYTMQQQQQQQQQQQDNQDASRSLLLLPPPSGDNAVIVTKYLSINAADRDYISQPMRFKFTARTSGTQDSSSLSGSYRDIVWMEATHLIVPMEIVNAQGSLLNTKAFYRTDFSLSYQYVLLALEGFDALYDGTNEVIRRAFTMFLYERDYKAPNGRGYVIMKPAQWERKCFSTPIASLRDINVSILKPNGTLFNNSTDSYTASHFEYETSNRMYLKVILDQYYDRNEMFVGDSIMLRNCTVAKKTGAVGAPAYTAAFEAFINRAQGHEIVQLGSSNDQGFVNAIYILAPGMLDTSAGRVIVDEQILSVVSALGQGRDDPAALIEVTSPATILNVSLQPVLTMRLGCSGGFKNMTNLQISPISPA